ncbi:MAG: peptidylprolyl isomerase, partial [Bacteroidota bacterium]
YLLSLMILIAGVSSCSSGNSGKQTHESSTMTEDVEEGRKIVSINTNYGEMVVELYNETPLHRDNFIKLVEDGFYNGLLFHRVINQFMIQGGDPESKNAAPGQMLGNGGPGYTIPAEINENLLHEKGALAAARLGDQVNPDKESSGSQFYIVQGQTYTNAELDTLEQKMGKTLSAKQRETYTSIGGTPHLDEGYTVFGKVISGMNIIDEIAVVQTDENNRPLEDVVIVEMKIVE